MKRLLILLAEGFAILSLILLLAGESYAQDSNNNVPKQRGLSTYFSEKKTTQKVSDLASNVLVIKNFSQQTINFSLNISTPKDWKSLGKKDKSYQIGPNDSLFVPVNIVPQQVSKGNTNHIVNASIIAEGGGQFASAVWYISIKKEINWNASVSQEKAFFLEGIDTVHFSVKAQNLGSSSEQLSINFISDKRLKVFSTAAPDKELKFVNVRLAPLTDSTLTFIAKRVKSAISALRMDVNTMSDLEQSETYPLRIYVKNESNGEAPVKTYRSTINFIKTASEFKQKRYKTSSMPMVVDVSVDNLLESTTTLNLGLYGSADLEKNRTLNYNFQTFFSNNTYSITPFLGYQHYIGYQSTHTTIDLGNINGFSGFGYNYSGQGIKAIQRLDDNIRLGAFFIQGSGWLNSANRRSVGALYEYTGKHASSYHVVQQNSDSNLGLTNWQYNNRFRFSIHRFHNFTIGSAISVESYNKTSDLETSFGYAYMASYAGTVKRLNYNITNSYGSAHSASFRGYKGLSATARYSFPDKSMLRVSGSYSNQNANTLNSQSYLLLLNRSVQELYELSYNIFKGNQSLGFSMAHSYTENLNLRSSSNGLSFDYMPRLRSGVRFAFSATGSYVNLPDYNIAPFFNARIKSSFRYKWLTSNLRYYYGANRVYEQLLFAQTQINSQSIFTNTNLKFWLKKDLLTIEPNVTYSYETLYKRTRASIRPEVYYIPKSNLELRFYAQYINNTQGQNPFLDETDLALRGAQQSFGNSHVYMGLGIKRKLGIPISGKRYNTLTIALFKDFNGNNKQEKDEPGIKNVMVNIKALDLDTISYNNNRIRDVGEYFISDESGKVVYKNLARGRYKISITPLGPTSGFFAGNDQEIVVDKDITYLMPLNQGVTLMGVLALERDATVSDIEKAPDIGRIRITALDSTGKTYSTLTDANGRFEFRIPAGIYQISINDGALPSNFEVENKRIMLEMLAASDSYTLTFIAREKKRKVNIKKFNEQGKLINTDR